MVSYTQDSSGETKIIPKRGSLHVEHVALSVFAFVLGALLRASSPALLYSDSSSSVSHEDFFTSAEIAGLGCIPENCTLFANAYQDAKRGLFCKNGQRGPRYFLKVSNTIFIL